jgi:hypothetical protein
MMATYTIHCHLALFAHVPSAVMLASDPTRSLHLALKGPLRVGYGGICLTPTYLAQTAQSAPLADMFAY